MMNNNYPGKEWERNRVFQEVWIIGARHKIVYKCSGKQKQMNDEILMFGAIWNMVKEVDRASS